jgi:hypothetical protein
MLAMDVVDTLRHADKLVERELAADEREAALKQRLREIYRTQGIDVPDRVIEQGVSALAQSRFVYRPTPPSFQRRVATIWTTRGRWGRPVVLGLLALLLVGGGWWFGVHLPAQQARIAEQQELSTGLPRALAAASGQVQAATRNPEVLSQADRLVAEGNAAARAGSLREARARLAALQALQQRLSLAYTVRIVSRPGTPSGVWRTPTDNAKARNFYLIVEGIDANGRPVATPISSEEDGRTMTVSQWGLRVSPETFERVRQEKMRDGVLQDPIVGSKQPGELDVNWTIPTNGGAILAW